MSQRPKESLTAKAATLQRQAKTAAQALLERTKAVKGSFNTGKAATRSVKPSVKQPGSISCGRGRPRKISADLATSVQVTTDVSVQSVATTTQNPSSKPDPDIISWDAFLKLSLQEKRMLFYKYVTKLNDLTMSIPSLFYCGPISGIYKTCLESCHTSFSESSCECRCIYANALTVLRDLQNVKDIRRQPETYHLMNLAEAVKLKIEEIEYQLQL